MDRKNFLKGMTRGYGDQIRMKNDELMRKVTILYNIHFREIWN